MPFKDEMLLCPAHQLKGLQWQELSNLAVFCRVVQRDEVLQIIGLVQRQHTFCVGSLIFHTLRQLLPRHMAAFHSPSALFPVGYEGSGTEVRTGLQGPGWIPSTSRGQGSAGLWGNNDKELRK